jgi:KDO2-lipid IV(A) lauroyltransferase
LAFEEEHIRVVYKELHSKFSDEFFRLNRVSALERMGVECTVESMQILRYAIKNRNEKKIYVYIADQFPYASLNYEVGQFLNQHTLGMLGGAGVAHKLGHGVLYMKMKRVERGRYEMTFETICDDASTMSPEDMMRKYYDLLEKEIRETPHNWLWTHKRWK